MKRLIFFLIILAIPIAGFSQSKWKGFFKPVSFDKEFTKGLTSKAPGLSEWKMRPAVNLTALQLTWDKTIESFNTSSLTSAGIGVSYAHFIDNNGIPFSNYGFNVLWLFDTRINDQVVTGMSIAGTVSAFQLVSVGAGYNFGIKSVFFLTGITYNFN